MIDTSLNGIRCCAAHDIRSFRGMVRASTEGTIQYEMERLGRHLINVQWDNDLILNVFPNQIEIIDGDLSWH